VKQSEFIDSTPFCHHPCQPQDGIIENFDSDFPVTDQYSPVCARLACFLNFFHMRNFDGTERCVGGKEEQGIAGYSSGHSLWAAPGCRREAVERIAEMTRQILEQSKWKASKGSWNRCSELAGDIDRRRLHSSWRFSVRGQGPAERNCWCMASPPFIEVSFTTGTECRVHGSRWARRGC
jgi:hypothetical protein